MRRTDCGVAVEALPLEDTLRHVRVNSPKPYIPRRVSSLVEGGSSSSESFLLDTNKASDNARVRLFIGVSGAFL